MLGWTGSSSLAGPRTSVWKCSFRLQKQTYHLDVVSKLSLQGVPESTFLLSPSSLRASAFDWLMERKWEKVKM